MTIPATHPEHEVAEARHRGNARGPRLWRRTFLEAGAALLVCCALAGCLFESTDIAGTNDETTTSLQILANNVRHIPVPEGSSSGAARAAGRAGGTIFDLSDLDDSAHWRPDDFEDHGTWSEWSMHARSQRVPLAEDPTKEVYRKLSRKNSLFGFAERLDSYVMDEHGTVSIKDSARFVNRSGFVWTMMQEMVLHVSGNYGHGWTSTTRLRFPSLDLHVDFLGDDGTDGHGLIHALVAGLPVLDKHDRAVGHVRMDTTTLPGAFRWFDLAHREIRPQELPFQQNAGDSIGLRILDVRRSAEDGDLVIEGRFFLPEEYGLTPGAIRVRTAADSVFDVDFDAYRGEIRSLELPPQNGRFSLRIPKDSANLHETGWLQVVFDLDRPLDSYGSHIRSMPSRLP